MPTRCSPASLAALKHSGQWSKTLLVVTADHGEEFGENGQIAHGGNLGHVLVEVPLVIKLPAGFAAQARHAGLATSPTCGWRRR